MAQYKKMLDAHLKQRHRLTGGQLSISISGIKSESIREVLHKNVDLIRFSNLENNFELVSEIMKDGIKIYG